MDKVHLVVNGDPEEAHCDTVIVEKDIGVRVALPPSPVADLRNSLLTLVRDFERSCGKVFRYVHHELDHKSFELEIGPFLLELVAVDRFLTVLQLEVEEGHKVGELRKAWVLDGTGARVEKKVEAASLRARDRNGNRWRSDPFLSRLGTSSLV